MAKKTITELERVFDEAVKLLSSSGKIEHAAPELIEMLARAIGCDWATYWKVESLALRPISSWSSHLITAPKLKADTQNRTLSLSEGTAGHVWRSGKPVWSTNLVRDMCLPRSLDPTTAGLQGGVWFALKADRATYGVIELLGRNLPEATGELLSAIETHGMNLGRLIQTSHSQEQSK